jgi:hypothetical protein
LVSAQPFFAFPQETAKNLEKYVSVCSCNVAEPHLLYAAPALIKNFDAAPAAPAPAPTLLYSKAKFLKVKVQTHVETIVFI